MGAAPVQAATQDGVRLGQGPDAYPAAVAQTVRSIAEYSTWPGGQSELSLCIVGPADHAERLTEFAISRDRTVRPRETSEAGVASAGCDIVYIGRLSLDRQKAVLRSLRGQAVLTISENDPPCRSQAMFCLLFNERSVSFRLNIDAVARSGIRVDPRVLRLGAQPGGSK